MTIEPAVQVSESLLGRGLYETFERLFFDLFEGKLAEVFIEESDQILFKVARTKVAAMAVYNREKRKLEDAIETYVLLHHVGILHHGSLAPELGHAQIEALDHKV